jgi:SAM-dependent methyltransferase
LVRLGLLGLNSESGTLFANMNERHLQLCASAEWAETVRTDILPWALGERNLGEEVLEIGPGPGHTTQLLRGIVPRLTAVEVDESLATALAQRMTGSNVEVVHADATRLPFHDRRFSGATAFTMLHHVPSAAQQDRLLAEVCRVLRPGGVLIGVDSIDGPEWRELHVGDICMPVDPATFSERLLKAGFVDVEVERSSPAPARRFRFAARVPAAD